MQSTDTADAPTSSRNDCCFALGTTTSTSIVAPPTSSTNVRPPNFSNTTPMKQWWAERMLQKRTRREGTTGDNKRSSNKADRKPSKSTETADADAMTSLIATELTQMSPEEREAAYEDLHGVRPRRNQQPHTAGNGEQQDPEANLDVLIEAVKREISKMRVKTAYDKAIFMCPSFVNDRNFFTMFLRADEYNIKNTADRIVLHFECKLDLFGIDKLVKKITLGDLSQGDLNVISSGCLYMSPKVKDVTGRTLGVAIQELFEFQDYMHQIRVLWYLVMLSIEEDEEAQFNGFVLVRYSVGIDSFDHNHMEYLGKCKVLIESLPMKIRGFHFCYDSERLRPIMAAIQLVLGRHRRVRFRAHFGSRVECLYALMGFGIVKESMPFDTNGRLKEGWHDSFIQSRMEIESQLQQAILPPYKILYPRPADVLLGRGRPYQDYPGNLFLAHLVEESREAYRKLAKGGKTQMANDLIVIIRERGGRFLKKDEGTVDDDGYWVEVTDEKAIREKVSHAFRTQTKRNKSATESSNRDTSDSEISGIIAASARSASSLVASMSSLQTRAGMDDPSAGGGEGGRDHEVEEEVVCLTRKRARIT